MSDRRLQVFHAVAELKSFTRAGQKLHMTQPAVTFQVRQLEEQFNTMASTIGEARSAMLERMKELGCLFKISAIAEKAELSTEEIFEQAVEEIPPGWQYPEITCARLVSTSSSSPMLPKTPPRNT